MITERASAYESEPKTCIETAIYLPHTRLTNEELLRRNLRKGNGKPMDEDYLHNVIGPDIRPRIGAHESVLSMGRLVARQVTEGRNIGSLVFATSIPEGVDYAKEIADTLHLSSDTDLMNIHAACSGGVMGLVYITSRPELQNTENVLIASEAYSPYLVPANSESYRGDSSASDAIFGDGAVAMRFRGRDLYLLSHLFHRFSKEPSDTILMPKRVRPEDFSYPVIADAVNGSENGKFAQNGPRVYADVAEGVPPLILQVADDVGINRKQDKLVFPHQGSLAIVRKLSQNIPDYTFFLDIREGNLSSAASLKAFIKALRGGVFEVYEAGELKKKYVKLKRDDIAILAGFGAGGLTASIAAIQIAA